MSSLDKYHILACNMHVYSRLWLDALYDSVPVRVL